MGKLGNKTSGGALRSSHTFLGIEKAVRVSGAMCLLRKR